MIKTTIFATIILFSAIMMLQESYGEFTVSPDRIEIAAIPPWVDQNFIWYGQGQISQTELLNALKYLLDNNIMHLSEKAAQEVQDLRRQVAEQQVAISALRSLVSAQSMDGSATQVGEVEVRGWDVAQKEEVTHNEKACLIYYLDRPDLESAIVAVDLRDYNFELPAGALNELEYCVQYRESNFDFVLRLMEEEGIYYFFEHGEETTFEEETDTLDITDIDETEPIEPTDDMVSASIQDLCFYKTEAEVEAEFDKLDANDTEGLSHDEWDFVQVFEDVAGQEPPNDIVTKKELVDWWKAKCIPP